MRRSPSIQALADIAEAVGLDFHIEPTFGFAAQLNLADGSRRYCRGGVTDINGAGATEIANDKAWTSFFLERLGYPVPAGAAFFTNDWATLIGSDQNVEAAWAYAKELGRPVIVKPNSQSQGAGVWLVSTHREFTRAVRDACRRDRVFLVQRLVGGNDFRLVVLDGEVVSAYQRVPFCVECDGARSLSALIADALGALEVAQHDIRIRPDDPRIAAFLSRQGFALGDIPEAGRTVPVLPVANLSAGGRSLDVTDTLHHGWREIARAVARDMNLRLAGLDILTSNSLSDSPAAYTILEVNAAPGLDNYAASGPEQAGRVRELYRRILLALADADVS